VKNSYSISLSIIISFLIAISMCDSAFAAVKRADLAGTWYPASKEVLSRQLEVFLNDVSRQAINGEIKMIIAPHAGLLYSGSVAAHSYQSVSDLDIKTVIILGFCHRRSFPNIAVYAKGSFATPLGEISIDEALAARIIGHDKGIIELEKVFDGENSIEMEIIFVQKIFRHAAIVPIAFGSNEYKHCRIMADLLAKLLDERSDILIVVSTDMSHYLSYGECVKKDYESIALLESLNAKEIYRRSVRGDQLFCGYMPVTAALMAAGSFPDPAVKVLKYANSGDITGHKDKVVGYVSAVIYQGDGEPINETAEAVFGYGQREDDEGEHMLNEVEKKRLLDIARTSIMHYLKEGKHIEVRENGEALSRNMGAFVTLHKEGSLRGCIGNMVGRAPLYLTVRDMAVEAACGDPRFPKVTSEEMNDIDIEISVLSEMERVGGADEIELGTHGVLVRKGFSSGVFLPQVATETGWSKEEFLTNLCAGKAGLLPDAWKTGEAELYVFTAEVFGEKDD